jgi:hypothetical protein
MKIKKIWVDIAGVIADYFAGKKENQSGNQYFNYMIDNHGFRSLPILPCKKLMKELSNYRIKFNIDINILTSYGRKENVSVINDKELWLMQFPFRFDTIVFVPGKEHKKEYATSDSILIDDTPSNIFDFIDNGGKAILHNSEEDTINRLRGILNVE